MTAPPDAERVRVRPVERADLLAVHRIERAAFPTPWPFEAFERFVDAPGFLVAEAASDGDAADRDGAVAATAEGAEAPGGTGDATLAGGTEDAAITGGTDDDDSAITGGTAAIDDGGVVGYVVAEVTPNHGSAFGHVKDLAVHPEHRRRGIASTLLEHAIVTLAGQGATSVKLEVREDNEPARTLYREFGFSPMRRREAYYEDNEDAIVLVLEL